MIIALSGYARSGKDTAAEGLVKAGFRRVAFADVLRDFLLALNPAVGYDYDGEVRVQDVISAYGWNGYKETEYGPEVRRLLQRLGTECGRELIGENVWVDAAFKNVQPGENIVITDCRFPNEANAVWYRDGFLVRITRPGVGPANAHPSETGLDDYLFDKKFVNDGTVKELQAKVIEWVIRARSNY